jgi:hypothetical protein
VQTGGGGSGWEVEDRPRRLGLTIWKKQDPYTMDVPIRFDGFGDDESVEDDVRTLNSMQRGTFRPNSSLMDDPPTVEIDGALPINGAKWVITGIDWSSDDAGVIYRSVGGKVYRVRQDATVHLTQFSPETRLDVSGGGNLRAKRLFKVRQGDDLRSISQKVYGTPDRWKEIQAANPKILRDPKNIKKLVGKEIRIPA